MGGFMSGKLTFTILMGFTATLFAVAFADDPAVDSNTVALWHFDEGVGDTVYDSSPNGNNGVIYGATWVDGKFGKGLDFKPADMSRVLAPNSSSLQITGAITIEAWIKPRNFGPEALNLIVQKGNGGFSGGNSYWFALQKTGKLQVELMGPGDGSWGVLEGSSLIDTGEFNYVAVTWNGTTDTNSLKFYINGILDTAGSVGLTSIQVSSSPLGIGFTPVLGTYFFDGAIDEVRISNIARDIFPVISLPPILDSIGPKSVNENGNLTFNIHATDPDTDAIILSVLNLPTNSNLVGSGNGTGIFGFDPDTTQAGVYNIIFIASDGILADSETVEITVNNCEAIPGDANSSGSLTLADIISTVNFIFNKPGCNPLPLCWISNLVCRGDWNGDTVVTLGDVIQGVNYVFNKPGGPWTPIPSGTCCLLL
jgi:hypothetical protein